MEKKSCKANRLTSKNNRDPNILWLEFLRAVEPDHIVWAYLAIYKLTEGMVYRIAYKILKDKQLAEDVRQNVFLKLWENRTNPAYIPHKSFKSLLYKITKNESVKYFRKKKMNQVQLSELENHLVTPNKNQPGQGLDTSVIEDRKKRALAGKRKQYRRDALSARLLGYSYKVIAEHLHKTEQQVRQVVGHARKDVEKKLCGTGYRRPRRRKKKKPG